MVAEGVDGAPRDWGELGDECVGKLICPAVGDDLWREIVANTLGWGGESNWTYSPRNRTRAVLVSVAEARV